MLSLSLVLLLSLLRGRGYCDAAAAGLLHTFGRAREWCPWRGACRLGGAPATRVCHARMTASPMATGYLPDSANALAIPRTFRLPVVQLALTIGACFFGPGQGHWHASCVVQHALPTKRYRFNSLQPGGSTEKGSPSADGLRCVES